MDPLEASEQEVFIENDKEIVKGGSNGLEIPDFQNDGSSPLGKSRAERRMQNRLKKGEKN